MEEPALAPIAVSPLDRSQSGRTLIMGIVNVTPDSFSDGGDYATFSDAVSRGEQIAQEGADIVDIGGESTRPGASEIDAETEAARVVPVVAALASRTAVKLSIDTYKAAVAEAALAAGAQIVNDVWGLQREPGIANVAASHGATVIIGHWERDTHYGPERIVEAMRRFFDRSVAIARKAGIADSQIVLDPGIGFSKDLMENLYLIDHLDEIVALGFPVLIGTSRKRFIGTITGREPKERLAGTLATNVIAAERRASIVRVHDVTAHREALAVTDALLSSRKRA